MKHALRWLCGSFLVASLWATGCDDAVTHDGHSPSADAHGQDGHGDIHGQDAHDQEPHAHGEDAHAQEGHGESSVEAAGMPTLVLDDGRKWVMDEHTRATLRQMQSEFGEADLASAEGLRATGQQLDVRVKELIKGCTMTGPAHDQLHVFLTDFIPAVNQLAATTEAEAGETQAVKIKALLAGYSDYFE